MQNVVLKPVQDVLRTAALIRIQCEERSKLVPKLPTGRTPEVPVFVERRLMMLEPA